MRWGNASSRSFTVEVVSPFGYVPDFAVLASGGRGWGPGSSSRAATSGRGSPAPAPRTQRGSRWRWAAGSTLLPGSKIAAQTVKLGGAVTAQQVFHVDGVSAGTGST